MSTVATKPMTAEEFFLTEEFEDGKYELVRGEIEFMPPPGFRHGEVQGNIAFIIKLFLKSHRLGRLVTESGAITERDPDSVRGPDVSFYSAARLPFGVEVVAYHDLPPDLCVEVRSPSDTKSGLRAKAHEYLAGGVKLVWVVDPEDHSVTVYDSKLKSTVLEAEATLTADAVLPGFSCTVADFFNG